MRRFGWIGWFCLLGLTLTVSGQSLQEAKAALRGLDAAFVLHDTFVNASWRVNETRGTKGFAPFGTLEIPLALAVLDARGIRHLDLVTQWNRLKYPLRATDAWEPTHWTEDQTLRSAFTNSVEWYWQESAVLLGSQRLQKTLRQFRYGNQILPDELAACWQDDALQISVEEQADFVQRLAQEKLPLSVSLQRNVKDLLLRERGADYRFYLKTCTGLLQNGQYLGWSIGWLETDQGFYIFALNLTHRDYETVKDAMLRLPKQLLRATGSWQPVE